MLAIEVKEITYKNYGKCVSISNGLIQTLVTVDVGPRIISFQPVKGQEMLYQDLDRRFLWDNQEIKDKYGEDAAFLLYGGHRLKIAPERMPESYQPDNQAVVYTLLSDGVRFSSYQKNRNIQLSFEIIMSGESQDMMVVHCAQNCTQDVQQVSLWGITALQTGGLLIVPQNEKNDLFSGPNRTFSLWPYSDLKDPRLWIGNQYMTWEESNANEASFKIGINNQSGWAAYLLNGYAFVNRFVYNHQASYPDHGSSLEIFARNGLLELESLSPFYQLSPQEEVRHVENWSVLPVESFSDRCNEKAIEQFVNTNL